jgi:DNA-binding Lrp family transcriptional regulator
MLDINDAIILSCAAQGGALASIATERTTLTRVAVSRRIKKLADSGYLERHGSGTRQTYSLGKKRFWIGVFRREDVLTQGGEMMVWERHLVPLLSDLPGNVKNLAQTAMSEMINNVLDHSQATSLACGLHLVDGQIAMLVADDGVGIFERIAQAAGLFDPRLAILELAKGKFTTAPHGHSGMGVFVSSRMMDGFSIESHGLRFDPHEVHQPLPRFEWVDADALLRPRRAQTVVRMVLALDSTRTTHQVYDKYFEPLEVGDVAFHTTEIPVRLARLSSELVSRSQAKWALERADQFKTVILDFEGVTHVGQAFVDEIYRVFACANPHIRLQSIKMSPEVELGVRRFGGSRN